MNPIFLTWYLTRYICQPQIGGAHFFPKPARFWINTPAPPELPRFIGTLNWKYRASSSAPASDAIRPAQISAPTLQTDVFATVPPKWAVRLTTTGSDANLQAD
jgi:hypothetical protein